MLESRKRGGPQVLPIFYVAQNGVLLCHYCLDFAAQEKRCKVDYPAYFALELAQLQVFAQDGLITLADDVLVVPPKGRLLIRNIAMVFNYYLSKPGPTTYSKVI